MINQSIKLLKKINDIEERLHSLKLTLLEQVPEEEQKRFQIQDEKEIIKAVRSKRKKIWREKYSKKV